VNTHLVVNVFQYVNMNVTTKRSGIINLHCLSHYLSHEVDML